MKGWYYLFSILIIIIHLALVQYIQKSHVLDKFSPKKASTILVIMHIGLWVVHWAFLNEFNFKNLTNPIFLIAFLVPILTLLTHLLFDSGTTNSREGEETFNDGKTIFALIVPLALLFVNCKFSEKNQDCVKYLLSGFIFAIMYLFSSKWIGGKQEYGEVSKIRDHYHFSTIGAFVLLSVLTFLEHPCSQLECSK